MTRILVIKLSSLGDLFHALPAVHLVKKATGAEIDWVTQPEYVDLVKCFPDVDRVIAFPRHSFMANFPAFDAELKRGTYDLILDMQGLLKSAFVARLARGKRRIGPSFSREGARLFYDDVSGATNKDRHAVEENLDMVRHLGLPAGETMFPVSLPDRAVEGSGPAVALVVKSRWPTKNWPVANFISVGRALMEKKGATIYLLGAPGDAPECSEIEREIGRNVVNLCGTTSLVDMAAVLQSMQLLVTVDSGPMHVAAALGVPVVAVFGSTDPRRTGPYGNRHRVITLGGLSCQPCFSRTCLRKERDTLCLTALGPDRVIEAALSALPM
jgi:heptosyltransferase-1